MMKILQIIKIMERFLLLSFLILVLGFNSGCSNDGTNSTPSGAGGTGGAGQAGGGGAGAPPILLAIVYVDGSESTTASEMTSDPPTANEGRTNGESAPTPAAPEPDGTSWEKAYKTLQAGIDKASEITKTANGYVRVHVAVGTYKPNDKDSSNLDRGQHFALKNNVSVYGGYKKGDDGTYTVVEDATKDDDKTILSGDLNGNDVATDDTTKTDNVYNVFYHPNGANLISSAKLENVTITKGNATGAIGSLDNGGGMYNNGSSPTLKNVTFKDNKANLAGGGMFNEAGASPELTNVTFTENNASNGGGMANHGANTKPTLKAGTSFKNNVARYSGKGGGMYNWEGASPTLTDVIFSDNKAHSGGGMANHGAETKPILNAGTSFSKNIATSEGGGMYNTEGASPELTNVIFSDNEALRGGGMLNYGAETKPILNAGTSFTNNIATSEGGGMLNRYGASPTLTEVTFSANEAPIGGGMLNHGAETKPILKAGTSFSENKATTGDGGGMYNTEGASPTLTGVTFTLNEAGSLGGGMANSGSSPELTDVNFTNNKATNGEGGGMFNNSNSNPSLTGGKFEGNEATKGGGMANGGSSPTLENVNFTNNKATNGDGGGMYNNSNSNPSLTGGEFKDNTATKAGGGMYNSANNPSLTDVTFTNNTADERGGAMCSASNANPTLNNVKGTDGAPLTSTDNAAESKENGYYQESTGDDEEDEEEDEDDEDDEENK